MAVGRYRRKRVEQQGADMNKTEIIDYLDNCIKCLMQGHDIVADLIIIKKNLENKDLYILNKKNERTNNEK